RAGRTDRPCVRVKPGRRARTTRRRRSVARAAGARCGQPSPEPRDRVSLADGQGVPRMSVQLSTFAAMLARDVRVLRRNFGQFLVRTIMQPLMFVFVFAYVFPKIGQGFRGGSTGISFTTVLVPGLIAVAINFQGIQAVALPLV